MMYVPSVDDQPSSSNKHSWIWLVGIVILLCGCAIAFYMTRDTTPHLKHDTFTFSIKEELPTTSDAYLSYDHTYEDVQFDPALFTMSEAGTYDVPVEFANQSFMIRIQIVDEVPPRITFVPEDSAELYRFDGVAQVETLFQISDDSSYTYEVTPASRELQTGTQEICVSAEDEYGNATEACKTMNLKFVDLVMNEVPQANSVEELVQEFILQYNLNQTTFGFYFYSMNDEETYVYHEDTLFQAASTIKVPLNMLYYDRYETGELSQDQMLPLTPSDIEEGDGYTAIQHELNQLIPYTYLQEQSIVYSDNTATNMLVRGLGGFNTFRTLLSDYSEKELPKEFYLENVVSMGYMLDVMKHLVEHEDRYASLIDQMKLASVGLYLQSSSDVFEIAQKYGSYDTYFHVTGIVYTPRPYIVGIYTNNRLDASGLIKELNEWLIAYQLRK